MNHDEALLSPLRVALTVRETCRRPVDRLAWDYWWAEFNGALGWPDAYRGLYQRALAGSPERTLVELISQGFK